MNITIPRRGVTDVAFNIEHVDTLAPERGGRIGGVSLGFPIWQANWQLARDMLEIHSDEWRSFADRLQGTKRPFVAYDHTRRLPKAYPDGFKTMTTAAGTAFDGEASAWSQTIDAEGGAQLELNGLPAGLVLGAQDYVGFRWDASGSDAGTHDRRTMVRVLDNAKANAAGTIMLTVQPAVPTLVVPANAAAHLDTPACMMRVPQGENGLGAVGLLKTISGGTITAVQDLRP